MPLVSLNAKYLPSGEIAPLFTGLSEELMVSCRSFRSGRGGYVGEPCLAYHRNADPISKIEAAHRAHGVRLDRLVSVTKPITFAEVASSTGGVL